MDAARLRIMIVEDEAAHAAAIRRALEAAGMDAEIHVAGTLREHRASVAAAAPDVALMDLNLPDGRAVEALTSPPEAGAFPVLIMTSYGNEQTVVEALKAGALDYVVKSSEAFAAMPRTIARALREWNLLQERKRAEEALREGEMRYRTLVELSPNAIVLADADGNLLMANQPAAEMYGASVPDELIGLNALEIIVPEQRSRGVQQMARTLEVGGGKGCPVHVDEEGRLSLPGRVEHLGDCGRRG